MAAIAAQPNESTSARTIPFRPYPSRYKETINASPSSGCPRSYNQTECWICFVVRVAAAAVTRKEIRGNAKAKRRKTVTNSCCLYTEFASHGERKKKIIPARRPDPTAIRFVVPSSPLNAAASFFQYLGANRYIARSIPSGTTSEKNRTSVQPIA